MVPKGFKYLETHEWASLEKDSGIVTVGLSDYAIEHLGDIVFLELPTNGSEVKKGQPFGVIESVKAASDLYAPASGKVVAINDELTENLEFLKSDTYSRGWIIKIKANDEQELETLMGQTDYAEYLKGL